MRQHQQYAEAQMLWEVDWTTPTTCCWLVSKLVSGKSMSTVVNSLIRKNYTERVRPHCKPTLETVSLPTAKDTFSTNRFIHYSLICPPWVFY